VRNFDSVSDAELVVGLSADAEAFEELFRRHRAVVTAYGARRCTQPADVADLVAATFLAVLEAGTGYDPARGPFQPWLVGVAHAQLGLLWRRESRERSLRLAAGGLRPLSDDAMARIEEAIDAARTSHEVEHAMAGLPPQQREVLWLLGHDGLSQSEAARALKISTGAFRVRLTRARRSLRAALSDSMPIPSSSFTQEVQ
jgi:RNA polymerase sigma factor (sigma-70 family)